MANVSRGVVKAPNNTSPGNHVNNGFLPLNHTAPFTNVPNATKSARENSCGPMQRTQSNCTPPNQQHRFNVENAHDGYTNIGVTGTGTGAVEVNPGHANPFGPVFTPAHMLRSDTAKK